MKNLASKFPGAALAMVLALLGLAGQVLADSVIPASYSTNLNLGQSVTITKTVTISAGTPTSAKVDVFFLADTTGSMGSAISNVQSGAASIMSATSGLGDVAYAVGEYKDVGDPYVYRLNQDVTKDTAAVQTGINAWAADGGGDWEEADLYGLYQAANTTSWRSGSTRILVWFGDAPSHDPAGPSPGVTEAQATSALTGQTIKVLALDMGQLNYYGQAQRIADATAGHYYTGVDVTQIVNVIKAAIISSFTNYSSVSLGTSSVPSGLSASVIPPVYTGSYDRSIDRTFEFSVTFTAGSPGSYSFTIPVLVDGGTMAIEEDNIRVAIAITLTFPLPGYTPTTAPVSAVMDNSVLERTPVQFYVPGNVIKAFNGETGASQYGVKYMDPYNTFWPA
ncbi:MAG: vWA domain-containing protein, partial [Desulfobaccales bacterium]